MWKQNIEGVGDSLLRKEGLLDKEQQLKSSKEKVGLYNKIKILGGGKRMWKDIINFKWIIWFIASGQMKEYLVNEYINKKVRKLVGCFLIFNFLIYFNLFFFL